MQLVIKNVHCINIYYVVFRVKAEKFVYYCKKGRITERNQITATK